MKFWRICRRQHASAAFSGEGAMLVGGRWNTPGIAMAYASEHLSLAAIELFVHTGRDRPKDLIAIEAELPFAADKLRSLANPLSSEWKADQNITRRDGDSWSESLNSVAVRVPSAVIDVEWNILLNPVHPGFQGLRVLQSFEFFFDPRMYKDNEPPSN